MKYTSIKGRFKPRNAYKYDGNYTRITFRSLWERKFMLYCDRSSQITEWNSEELSIPYEFENKKRSYYPDFLIKTCEDKTMLIEIKPSYQCRWSINQAKWKAAREYCALRGWEFKVLTEKELYV